MTYYRFAPESPDGEPYGSCEVFYHIALVNTEAMAFDPDGEPIYYVEGWYWQPCFPGCMPDGEPVGPFASEGEAMADAGVAP